MKTIELYSDGSCQVATSSKNGTCAIVVVDQQKIIHKQGYKYEDTTNNRMELMGCIHCLKWLEKNHTGRAYIHMDSQYVQLGITEWISGWKKRDWKTAGKKPVVNQDLWMELDRLKTKLPMVQFQWVRGHNNNTFNEMADQLCISSYSQLSEEEKERQRSQGKTVTAKEFLIDSIIPLASQEEKEMWYNTTSWASTVVKIMEQYRQL